MYVLFMCDISVKLVGKHKVLYITSSNNIEIQYILDNVQ